MLPLDELTTDEARGLAGLFTDIDDTLTLGGKLPLAAYRAICRARDAGLHVVPVTGRPGGWAEVLAHLFPVDAVVAENGALYVRGDDGEQVYWDPPAVRAEQRRRLDALRDDLLARFPFARVVDDQPLRRVDLAFDIGERVHLPPDQVATLAAAIESHGARSLVSTVHAHAYFGDHDKARMLERLAARELGADAATARMRYLFVGDSPNDQAGFAHFALTVGVANVARYESRLSPPPRYVTRSPGGLGFAELVDRILPLRS